MLSLRPCREILDNEETFSDEELNQLRDQLRVLAEIAISMHRGKDERERKAEDAIH